MLPNDFSKTDKRLIKNKTLKLPQNLLLSAILCYLLAEFEIRLRHLKAEFEMRLCQLENAVTSMERL